MNGLSFFLFLFSFYIFLTLTEVGGWVGGWVGEKIFFTFLS